MSLLCGNCRTGQHMSGNYFMLYLVEQMVDHVGFADGENEGYVSPNCAICKPCAGNALDINVGGDRLSAGDYALVPGDSGGGSAMWSNINTDASKAIFFKKDLARRRWSNAMEIIDSMAASNPKPSFEPSNPGFFGRLVTYLKTCDFKVLTMTEIATDAIIVEDNFDKGERDLYFDSEHWNSTSAAMPMDFMTRLQDMQEHKLGVLEGISFMSPPQRTGEFMHLAKQVISPLPSTAWHEAPKSIVVPQDLRP